MKKYFIIGLRYFQNTKVMNKSSLILPFSLLLWTSICLGQKTHLLNNVIPDVYQLEITTQKKNKNIDNKFDSLHYLKEEYSVDCYISAGDNHWLGQSLAVDSEKSIYDALKMLKDVFNTKTFYWRGMQEAAWTRTLNFRKENYLYAGAFKWFEHLDNDKKIEQTVTRIAHKMGIEVWGVSTLGDWGSPADTPGFNDFPFCFESKLRIDHPEWVPVDKYGYRCQGGTIELAYPEARKALVELHTQLAKEAGYDGVSLLTYVENFSLRFEDEFGYSEPIVQEFKKRYGIDIRSQEFTKSASRFMWYKLRGEYVTKYFQELKESLNKEGIKLGVFLDPVNPNFPMTWATLPHTHPTIGKMYMDINTWVRKGIIDRLHVFGGVPADQILKTTEDLIWLTKEVPISVSICTSNPYGNQWDEIKQKNVKTIITLGEDVQYFMRSNIPEQNDNVLLNGSIYERMRFLSQVVEGKSTANSDLIIPLAKYDNVIMRRLSLLALGKLKDPKAVLAIENALTDDEIGVKCAAIRALSDNSRPESIQAILRMLEKNPYHPLKQMCRSYLHRMRPFPKNELIDAALNNPVDEVRTTAFRILKYYHIGTSDELVEVFKKGLEDISAYARFSSTMALGKFVNNKEVVDLLIASTDHFDPVVQDRAAVSLGEMMVRKDKAAMAASENIIAVLKTLFMKFKDGSSRSDKEWGYRSVGNALMDCGNEGIKILEVFTKQEEDKRLAELAWRVLSYKEKAGPNKFNLITEKENDVLFNNRPAFLEKDQTE